MAILRNHRRYPERPFSVLLLLSKGGASFRGMVVTICLCLSLLAGATVVARGELATSPEYLIKAAFLYNFAKFVEWPSEAFKDNLSTINLWILGKDPFGEALRSISDKTVKGRKLSIKYANRVEEITGCHILYVGASEKENLKHILSVVKNSAILTVGDMEKFAQRGGVINLIMVENKIQFEINPDAAQQAGLKISSQLLRLARIVSPESRKERE